MVLDHLDTFLRYLPLQQDLHSLHLEDLVHQDQVILMVLDHLGTSLICLHLLKDLEGPRLEDRCQDQGLILLEMCLRCLPYTGLSSLHLLEDKDLTHGFLGVGLD
jgi:hypothetical protein